MFKLRGRADKSRQDTPGQKPSIAERLGDWRDWLNIVLLFAVLEIAVLSLERAHWISPQPTLTLVLVLSVLAVWLLVVISRLHNLLVHLLALIIGAGVTWWQMQSLLAYQQTFYFALFLTVLTWLTGYLSTWFLLRKKNAWVAVCLGALVILVNLSNLPARYYLYFGFFFVAAIFLLVQTRLVRRRDPEETRSVYTGRGWIYFISTLLGLVILAVSVSWILPGVRIPQIQTMISTKILWKNDFEKSRFNIFASVPSKQALSTSAMLLNLNFEPAWHQGDQIDFIVDSDTPSYWQVYSYGVYTSAGWENNPITDSVLASKTAWDGTAAPAKSREITYTVTPNIQTDGLLTSGSFISANKPVLVQVSSGDIISVVASHVLSIGESYTVKAAAAQPTAGELAHDGEDYPAAVLANYLQLPPDFPESVRQLSANLTGNSTTPYQKVLLINNYLSRIPYSTQVTVPPEGTDGVAYFLFKQKSGFCVHFASAMAVMLRASGVPTRLAVGYLPGEPGKEPGEYVLKDKFYHAWPQVYFPEYGWVNIEATPSTAEGAASEVVLDQAVVSSDVIKGWPQWDVWFAPGLYGINMGPGGGSSAAIGAAPSPDNPQWAFANNLGQALLVILIIVFFLIVLMVPFLFRRSLFFRWVWHVNREDLDLKTYEKLCRLGAVLKIAPRSYQTPSEYAAVLVKEFPGHSGAVNRITEAYLERRFGRKKGSLKVDLFIEAELLKARFSIFNELLRRMGRLEKIFGSRTR